MPRIPGTHTCSRCRAIVAETDARSHYDWHAEAEDLDAPTSNFGFWHDGRWNMNTRNW